MNLHSPASQGFPGGSSGKKSAGNAGDVREAGLIPGLGKSPGGGHGNPLQYPSLDDFMNRAALWAAVMRLQRVSHD